MLQRGEPGSVSPVGVSRGLLPMEKGTKALLFLNCPLSPRKCWELKSFGVGEELGVLQHGTQYRQNVSSLEERSRGG